MEEIDQQVVKTETKVKPSRAKPKMSRVFSRCLYCGKEVWGEVYCTKCRNQGFDDLHKATNRSNGWEREFAKRQRGVVESGWRGPKVLGGGSVRPRLMEVEIYRKGRPKSHH